MGLGWGRGGVEIGTETETGTEKGCEGVMGRFYSVERYGNGDEGFYTPSGRGGKGGDFEIQRGESERERVEGGLGGGGSLSFLGFWNLKMYMYNIRTLSPQKTETNQNPSRKK